MEAGKSVRGGIRRDDAVPRLIVDPDRIRLRLGDVVVKSTHDGGYVCIGFGTGAQLLDAIREDRNLNKAIDAEERVRLAVKSSSRLNGDRFLQRLGIAVALKKGGYDQGEDRDDHGRWTREGAGAAAGSVAGTVLDLFSAKLSPSALTSLGELAARVSVPTAFLGTLIIPTNGSLISEGALPNAPGMNYHFDQGTGRLTLTREYDDGLSDVVYSARYGLDGVFRDDDGNAIGRQIGGSVILDPNALPGYRSQSSTNDQSGIQAQVATATDDDQPKLCPDPGLDKPGWESRSERSLAYQEQITGLPRGLAVDLNGVSFDGCRDGIMIEAKGPGYEEHMDEDGGWEFYFTRKGLPNLQGQMRRQSEAAGGRPVEWHIAEKPVADYLGEYARQLKFTNVSVIYDPPRGN